MALTKDMDMLTSSLQPKRIIRRKELQAMIGIANSTLYDWLNPKSPRYDAGFPRQIKLGHSTVGWLQSEIDAWIDTKKSESRK